MASGCSSSVSLLKSNASMSNRKLTDCDEIGCSKRPSCVLQRKKPVNPLAVSIRPPKVDIVKQRVRSARMLRIRSLQSQLNDANYHLMELTQENRALKSTQRRQDKALNNYEGVNADLPRLIQSHGDENRVLLERNRLLKKQLRNVTDILKVRDEELLVVKDQLKQLSVLAKDKQLEERDQLRTNLNEAKDLIKSYESEISILNRKLALEVKNCRQKVNSEVFKFRKCQDQLADVLDELNDVKGKSRLLNRRFDISPGRDRKSTTNLSTTTSSKETTTTDSDVKLEPIKKRNSAEARNTLTSPVEKIKARLSGETRPKKIEDFSDILEKLNLEEEHLKKTLQSGIKSTKLKATKLETLVQKRNGFLKAEKDRDKVEPPPPPPPFVKQRFKDTYKHNELDHDEPEEDEDNEDIEEVPRDDSDESPRLENLHKAGPSNNNPHPHNEEHNGQNFDDMSETEDDDALHRHVQHLQESEREFQRVQDEIDDIDKLEQHIDRNTQSILLNREDNDLVNEIWNEEYAFREAERNKPRSTKLTNGDVDEVNQNKKDPLVALEKKRKLLAALREIDNGNSIEHDVAKHEVVQLNNSNNEIDSRKSRLMKELFG